MSPDRGLVHALLAQGVTAFFVVTKFGINAEHLFDENRVVFKFVEEFIVKGRTPSLEEVQIATGIQLDPTVDGSKIDAQTCVEALVRRSLGKQIAKGIGHTLELLKQDPAKAREYLNQLVTDTTWSTGQFPTLPDPHTVDEIRQLYLTAEAKRGQLLGWGSPWASMDAESKGLQNGELTVLFAKKKLGKTWTKLAWVEHIWANEMTPEDRILFVSLEMQPRLVYRRLAAVHLKLDYGMFRAGLLPTPARDRFLAWCDDLEQGRLTRPKLTVISSNEAPSVRALSPIVAQLKPKLLVIDSFYMLQNKSDSVFEKTLANTQQIKLKLANAFDIPVLASTQLKGTVKRDVVDADTDDAAYAKAIGDYADVSRGLFGSAEHIRDRRRIFRGLETREFEGADLLINFDLRTMDFSEISKLDSAPQVEDTPKQDRGPKGPAPRDDDDGPILSI